MTNKPLSETKLTEMANDILDKHPEVITYRHFMNLFRNASKYKEVDFELRDNVCKEVYWGRIDKRYRRLTLDFKLAKLKEKFFSKREI